jgi:hypothetical protein
MAKNKITILHLKYLNLPLDNRFEDLIDQVIDHVIEMFKLKYKTQKKIIEGYQYTARAIIEGLNQVYASRYKNCRLGTPASKSGYGKKPYQISDHKFIVVERITEALQSLKWVSYRRGFKNREEENLSTSIRPIGELLRIFEESKFVWRQMGPIKSDVIVLKGYDEETGLKEIISFKDNNEIRKWRKNLQKINQFFTQNAICLDIEEFTLDKIIKRMANDTYQVDWMFGDKKKKARVFNFLHIQLRRIFARGRFDYGGRFYGGWWQFIPSEYRSYITINGLPTGEIDYSELHPRLMYLNTKLPLPEGDLYDLGLRYEGIKYNKNIEPYKSKRKVIKTYINAVINDDKGRFKLDKSQEKIIGMTTKELEELVVKKHPMIKDIKGKGFGLQFQFTDSQIAEKVMLKMMDKGIVCLPVHDSFISQREHLEELREVMEKTYEEVLGVMPLMKDSEESQTDFEPVFYPSGQPDFTYQRNRARDDIHTDYLSTFIDFTHGKKRRTRTT